LVHFVAVKFAAMKFDVTKYGANGFEVKFLENPNLRKIILDKGRLSDKRIKLKSFVKFKMKW
jgi:hypothetical protein